MSYRSRFVPSVLQRVLATALTTLLVITAPSVAAEILHQEHSLYRNIVVRQNGDERCLLFTVRRADRNQSCMDMDDPDRLVFPYARMMLAGLLIEPDPERILLIGLGGGSLPRTFATLFPEAEQDLIEIDPAVVRVAREYFDFRETPQMDVHVRDARVFVKRALAAGERYDYVMLDAFTGDYIPEHLMTREFLQEVGSLLTDDGVVVANTFASSELYHHESATYAAAFDHVAQLRLPITLNRILVATDGSWPDAETIRERARELAPRLRRFGADARDLARHLEPDYAFDTTARVLTDQYSPVNLLQGN